MECAASESRAGGGGGVGKNVKMRLCLRAIRLLVAVASIGGEDATAATGGDAGGDAGGTAKLSPASTPERFAEAALELTCDVVEREWVGRPGMGGDSGESARGREGEDEEVREVVTE